MTQEHMKTSKKLLLVMGWLYNRQLNGLDILQGKLSIDPDRLSKQKTLDEDVKVIQRISFTGNLDFHSGTTILLSSNK